MWAAWKNMENLQVRFHVKNHGSELFHVKPDGHPGSDLLSGRIFRTFPALLTRLGISLPLTGELGKMANVGEVGRKVDRREKHQLIDVCHFYLQYFRSKFQTAIFLHSRHSHAQSIFQFSIASTTI